MSENIDIIKGIHPGEILGRELKKRALPKGRFALQINEFPQTLGAIINGKRRMNAHLAIKIEDALGFDEGYFMVLQAYYDVKQERQKMQQTPDLSKFRKALFWDTDITTIDWQRYKEAIIKRVFERGNDIERAEVERFYPIETINAALNNCNTNQYKPNNEIAQ